MIIRSRIDDSIIQIDIKQNIKYGIMLSGGIDSAIMFYLILLDAQQKNIVIDIQPFSTIKYDESYTYVNPIIDYFNQQFNVCIPYTILVGEPSVHHSLQSRVAAREIKTKYPLIEMMFNGLNQNPPPPFDLARWGEGRYPNRIKSPPSMKDLMPFISLYKSHIIDLVFQYQQEQLFEITHSCTEWTKGRCMQCFQCNERKWAFDFLKKEDPGNL